MMDRKRIYRVLGWFVLACTIPAVANADSIWIEGENPQKKTVTKHGWYDNVRKDGMSGGEWLSHYDKRRPGIATYSFTAEKSGEYTFWWRGNVLLSEVAYQLNGGDFATMSLRDKRGQYQVSPNPDHRALAWVKVGSLRLRRGKNSLTIRFQSKVANHGGTDAILLDDTGFVPSGIRKPNEDIAAKPDEWFPVVFDTDRFSADSVIDMSKYIEAPAGQHGFLKRDGDALRFEHAKQPIKFWGCGANVSIGRFTREQQTTRIKYLCKHGVNMVRQHPLFGEVGPLQNGRFDAKRIDEFDWYFAELKKHGLYMTWSVFYPLTIGPNDGYDAKLFAELPDAGRGRKRTYGLVNIEPKLQELQWDYVKTLLLHKNPYTGLRYIDDPALAVLETHNEDSIFWHFPLGDLRDPKKFPLHSKRLRQKFFAWVKQKYGSEAATKQAWGRLRRGDSWQNGELELMGAYHFGGDGPAYDFKGQTKRAGDFIEFLARLQKDFYERREGQLRDLGYKAVTVTTAWKAGGPSADPANLWTDLAADMIDRHNYFGGGSGGHHIAEGAVRNESHLSRPGGGLLAIGLYQVENRPFSCTEWTQLPPNQWKAEAAPLMAFYGMGLQGWDASYHFSSSRAYPGDGWPNLSSYVTDTPHYIGQFPALFFALHHGHIEEGPVVARRTLSEADLFAGTDPLHQDLSSGHDVKDVGDNAGTSPTALAVGRVTIDFDKNATAVKSDLSRNWNRNEKTVRSATGDLKWDYDRRLVTIQAEKTQGVIGRMGGESIELPGVTVAVQTPFVSLLFTPLDNQPLAASTRILITAMARDQQTGTEYSADGTQLKTIGGPPLLMEPVQAGILFKGSKPKRVNVLDVYGVPTGKTVPTDASGKFHIDGRFRTYYYEVER
ncbi:hypothetical protein [Thalassoroseus pseudoceratinae]|uniref:hypothetical protein n=1 Tax=Thalassoroseus pseudoceratinae TaxID=2713176 RepID=UPI00141E39B3|nr:hypothetical protein [Thalassoroseus pseudoceratinae]